MHIYIYIYTYIYIRIYICMNNCIKLFCGDMGCFWDRNEDESDLTYKLVMSRT